MKPIEFKEQNCVYAKDQPEYIPLPVHKTEDGMVISCWSLTWRERIKLLFTGKMWWMVMTFNAPLQPVKPDITSPFCSANHQAEKREWRAAGMSVSFERQVLCRCGCGHAACYLLSFYDYDPRGVNGKGNKVESEPCCESAKDYIAESCHELGLPEAVITPLAQNN